MNFEEKIIERLKRLEREVERLRVKEKQVFVPLTTPLTSTAWDGDAFSTTSKTLIDLSTVFGAPAGIKAILAEYSIKDSGSSNGTCRLVLSANNANMTGVHLMGSPTNNHFATSNAIIPCDVNGDIYYQIVASGTNTMTIYIQILGYWL